MSELRERHKFSTVKRGRSSLSERRKYFTPVDHVNEANISKKVKELFANNHRLLEGWHRYSENENKVCGHIMGNVSLSHGQDMNGYWNEIAGAIANRCWIDLRVIKEKNVSKVCQGETTYA